MKKNLFLRKDQANQLLPEFALIGQAPTLQLIPMPSDASHTGDVFGGSIMSQIDLAGSVPATRIAKGRVATVAVERMTFKAPVLVADLVSFYTQVVREGRTSITVDVKVFAQRLAEGERFILISEAQLTYVAVDSERRPRVFAAGA